MMFSVTDKPIAIRLLFVILLLISALQVSAQIQEEPLPHTQTFREMALRLDVLESNYQGADPVVTLEQLSTMRQNCQTMLPRLSPAGKQEALILIHRTLMLEAVLHYYSGRLAEAESVANDLLQKEPSISLPGNLATPDVAEWFENIREKHTGFISVFSDPSGSIILLDGIEFGLTPLEDAFAPVGNHVVEIILDGYETYRQEVTVVHQETQVITARLKKEQRRRLRVGCSPRHNDLGQLLDPADRDKTAHQCLLPLIQTMGFDPLSFSEPVYVRFITPGDNTIRMEKPCRQPISYSFKLEAADYFLPLVVLPKTETRLSIESKPSNQNVYIDGDFFGTTPLIDAVVCPGERTVRVAFSDGTEWLETKVLEPDDNTEASAHPRPTLFFLGCVSSDKGLSIEGDHVLREWLVSTGKMNIMSGSGTKQYRLRPVVASVLESLGSIAFDPDEPGWRAKLENMVASLSDIDASIIAFAKLEPLSSTTDSRIFFIHRDSARPDMMMIPPGLPSAMSLEHLNSMVCEFPPQVRLRSGLRITEADHRVIISQVIPGGPAETSPLQVGDIIQAMNGKLLSSRMDFESVLQNPGSPESMLVSAIRGDRQIMTTIEMKRQPMISALSDHRIPSNLLLAYLETDYLRAAKPTDPVLIQAGVCCLAIKRPDRARDYFSRCSLSDLDGFGTGTLHYLKYLAEKGLQNKSAADLNLKTALEAPGATIIHGDGPWLRDLLQ